MDYKEFLKQKIDIAPDTGFDVNHNDLCKDLLPHQKDAVIWALKGGKRALFESFGLGKTLQQLEIIRQIIKKYGGKGLIVCPLGIKQEFARDAKRFLDTEIQYVTCQKEIDNSEHDILITNYERVRDGDIDPKSFIVTTLDEASVLRSYGSKTYQDFLIKFKGVQFKYVCTATPSPNKYKELIHYAGYLEIMDTGQALTRFFQRDSTKANKLTLYPHKEKEFWFWLSTWALFITKPSDLGYSDKGYDLPAMDIHYHEIKSDHITAGYAPDGQSKMFRDAAIGLKDAAKEKRESVNERINKMLEIINNDKDSHYIIWHDLEYERTAIKKALPEVTEVYGSLDINKREERINKFSDGELKYLATKPRISGSGCNFQRYCHKAIFLGIGYKFNDFIQAIHRIYRFLQDKQVEIHIIYMESEIQILKTLQAKWRQHDKLVENMKKIMKDNGLASTNILDKLARTIGIDRIEQKGKYYTAVNNDCIIETSEMKDNSIDMIVTSIPFSNHYEYTPSYNDFGHNPNNDKFFEQMDYLTPNLLRILKPGRIAAIHTKDRILFGNATGTGMPTTDPFSDMTVFHFMKHGFQYVGRITIVTDVVRENNQTYRLGWTEQTKDGTKMGVGCPEYVLLFRKLPTDTSRAYADVPVTKTKDEYPRGQWQLDAHAFWKSDGKNKITEEILKQVEVSNLQAVYREYSRNTPYDYKKHVELAQYLESQGKLPASFMVIAPGTNSEFVWDDVNRMRTLNSEQKRKNLMMHICPLQFDIIERLITRYSNEKELIFDPFGGIMTVPYVAMKMNRYAYATELNNSYFNDGLGYCKQAEFEIIEKENTLF